MKLSDISIKNPVFAWMIMGGLIVFGAVGYSRLGLSQLPDVDFPVVNINFTLEGASPQIMEVDVLDLVEDALMAVEGIREIRSTARQDQASITIELDLDRNVDFAVQEIQARISQAGRRLPRDLEPAVITKTNPEDDVIMWVTTTYEGPRQDLMVFARYFLRDQFQTIPGVGDIRFGGYVDRNLRVWIDGDRLSQYQLTVDDVMNTIDRQHAEVPGGRLETPLTEFRVRSFGETFDADEFSRFPIVSRGGAPIYRTIRLSEVADIEDGLDDVRRITRVDGVPSVGLGIRKQRGANTVEVARAVRERIEEVRKDLPEGYNIMIGYDGSSFIEESMKDLQFTLVLSALLTGLVVWFFLGSISSTINIFLAIPTSIIGSFLALYFFDFTLNTFTLLALSLAIGIVVDDAIMMLENIVRHREKGENRVEGAMKGAREISFAVIATTATLVAVFLPVAFMHGIIGSYFFQFALTLCAAVILSSVEALSLTPMRASIFLRAGEKSERSKFRRAVDNGFDRLADAYRWALSKLIPRRGKVLIAAFVIFGLSVLLVIPLDKEFVPAQDQSRFFVIIRNPVGVSLERTNELMLKAEEFLNSRPEVFRYVAAAGGFGGQQPNMGNLVVTMHDPSDRPVDSERGRRLTQSEFESITRDALGELIPDTIVVVRNLSTRGFTASQGFPVEFSIRGQDWHVLGEASQRIRQRMRESNYFTDVNSNYEEGQPEIQVYPDRDAANLRGVNIASIGNVIGAMVGGRVVGQFTDQGRRFDIRVRLKEDYRESGEDINKLYVRNDRGELVRLSEVVDIQTEPTLLAITRIDRERAITHTANPSDAFSQAEAMEAALRIAREELPDGYRVALTGSARAAQESTNSMILAIVLGIIAAYMILGSQFNSFKHPLIILLALPFSFTGAFVALLITGQSLNIYSFIGLVLLMGLVMKNSILLVEFTNQMRKSGMTVNEALYEACPVRLRPILMTTVSTLSAAMPPALALGPGAETRIPMAVAVLGGMTVSSLLTLFVIPCAYSLFCSREDNK